MKEKRVVKNQKSKKSTIYNIEMLYEVRKETIDFFDNYSSIVFEAKNKATKGTGLKILTPKQILQRLPIALAQIKAGNNSENLLNEVRKLFILCVNQKKSLKRYIIT